MIGVIIFYAFAAALIYFIVKDEIKQTKVFDKTKADWVAAADKVRQRAEIKAEMADWDRRFKRLELHR